MQDEKIPIASVQASDFGIWVAQYIEGNCRFYDLIRLRKLAKIGARVYSASNLPGSTWRFLPNPVLCATNDAFFGVTTN
jgi:hypothetical protein